MEIYGFIPVLKGSLGNFESQITIPTDRFFIEGTETAVKNTFNCVLTAKCVVIEAVPKGDVSSATTNNKYEKYVTISTGVTITTNDKLDILTISPFELVKTTGDKVTITDFTSTIVNLLFTHNNDTDTDNLIKKILGNLNDKLPSLDLDAKNFIITDGKVDTEPLINGIQGISGNDRLVWIGNYPLDKLIYVIRSNLDILNRNQLLKDDQYAGYYAQLFQQAMTLAVDLEKHRLSTLMSLYLGLLKALGDYELSKIQLATAKLQCRVYYAQYSGFKSNNINKLFGTQVDGASSAFSAGMTDVTPPIFNDATLMNTYSQVATSMADM